MRSRIMTRARGLRACAVSLSIAGAALARDAHAQQAPADQLGVAQVLWDQGLEAMNRKDYAAACPKIAEVVRLRPDGLGAKLKLAECYEGAGRLASAWAMYGVVESLATSAKQPDRVTRAHQRREALEPQLAHVTIVVPDAVRALPGLEIERDDALVGPAQWGVPLPVDKGRHVIVVTATGKERWEKPVEIAADGAAASLSIEGLADAKLQVVVPPQEKARRSLAPGLVIGAVGVVAVGAGVAFLGLSSAKKSTAMSTRTTLLTAHQSCVSGAANFAGQTSCGNLASQFKADDTFHDVAIGAFIVGAAAAVGTAAYFLWPVKRPAAVTGGGAREIRVIPVIAGRGDGGLLVSGSF
jgi:hypothetical protein